ncbi:nuclear transport factor 2 family protein [Streptomyces niveus]|uniref:nuclear transport factor 2 family protein n=1 Tax=Streptomyces niveus TaxID=193462 RepID=UPI0036609912
MAWPYVGEPVGTGMTAAMGERDRSLQHRHASGLLSARLQPLLIVHEPQHDEESVTTNMTTGSTALDRYMGLSDRAVHDGAALDEALALFAADATVEIGPEPAHGSEAIAAFYRAHFAAHTEMKHFWNTTVLDDGTLRAELVCAARKTDGSLITVAGVEHATLDAQGLISHLHNEFTRLPG